MTKQKLEVLTEYAISLVADASRGASRQARDPAKPRLIQACALVRKAAERAAHGERLAPLPVA